MAGGYDPNECTGYVFGLCPWYTAGGNAWEWASRWKAAGHQTTMVPTAGTIACFQPGVEGANGTGHVAYVQSVQADGSFTVTESNCAGCGSPPGAYGKPDMRTGLKPGIGVSFLLPPAGAAAAQGGTGSLVAAPVASSNPSVLGAVADLTGISGLIGTIVNGGEVLLGAGLALFGLWFLAKDSPAGAPVKAAASLAADVTPGKVGKAVRVAKAPAQAAKRSRAESDRREATNRRDSERNERDANRREIAANSRRRAAKSRSVPGYTNAQRKSAKKRYQTGDTIGTATVSKVGKTSPEEIPF